MLCGVDAAQGGRRLNLQLLVLLGDESDVRAQLLKLFGLRAEPKFVLLGLLV